MQRPGLPTRTPETRQEPPDVAEAQPQALRRLGPGEPVFENQVQCMVTMQLVLAHRNPLDV